MQIIRIKPRNTPHPSGSPGRNRGQDLTALTVGAVCAVAGAGALLALTDTPSPLRGLFTLFFLIAAPAAAIGAALHGMAPFCRVVTSVAGALAADLLVAQGMLTTHQWSVRGGVVAVTGLSSLVLLLVLVRRPSGRTERRRTL